MVKTLKLIDTECTNPYSNLAFEEQLALQLKEDEVILFLWQNRRTVVIGRNQNAYAQCNIEALDADKGFLARRKSGGGAVFHDMGNLNFTFCSKEENYSVDRQFDVIVCAVKKLGINAQRTGRNDITIDGKKFSGNAFYKQDGICYHHGTILVDTDKNRIAQYLNVSAEKLTSKGVDSVRSRVCNLVDFAPDINVAKVKAALAQAFDKIYGLSAASLLEQHIETDRGSLRELAQQYSSWDWLFGRKIEFTNSFSNRFNWGEIQLELRVESGIIQEAAAYTDAIETRICGDIMQALVNTRYALGDIEAALASLYADGPLAVMMQDVISLIRSKCI